MGDDIPRPAPRPASTPAFDPRTTPVPRRRVLLLIGAGALAAGSLGGILAGCTGPPIPVELDIDPDDLVPGTPMEVEFALDLGDRTVAASAWLVKRSSGEIIAFDPRCTHGLCSYAWLPDVGQFSCRCHDGNFAPDGTVISGKPTRDLDRLVVRVTGDAVEVDMPGNFATPRESLPD